MFKVGDRVWEAREGWGEVVDTEAGGIYKIRVKLERFCQNYTSDGKLLLEDKYPILFFNEITEEMYAELRTKTKWRAEEGDIYYFVGSDGLIYSLEDLRDMSNNRMFKVGNYFKNEEEAKESKYYKMYHEEE